MNINIKNCEVNIIGGKTLEISGKAEPKSAAETEGVISTKRTYTLAGFMANKASVQIGDRVTLPAFTVPAAKIDGKETMSFGRTCIADDAIVIDKEADGSPVLLFSHCLFESAMDLNGEKDFAQTQLARYLKSEFQGAMNDAGIPAEDCGLASREDMFGENSLPYFKDGRNRVAFSFGDHLCWYWLATLCDRIASGWQFCSVLDDGDADCNDASNTYVYVRPRFKIAI